MFKYRAMLACCGGYRYGIIEKSAFCLREGKEPKERTILVG